MIRWQIEYLGLNWRKTFAQYSVLPIVTRGFTITIWS
jgi:hypothetical protein